MNKVKTCAIVAIARNRAIGKDNGMIWHLPEDLKHFKRTTMGKPVVMGRKSFESLGKPLPGRPNIVISRAYTDLQSSAPTPLFKDMENPATGQIPKLNEGPFLCASIEEGLSAAQNIARELDVNEIFITGGGEIYKQTLPLTQRLYLTILDRDYEGDTFFPEIDFSQWALSAEEPHPADPAHDRPAFRFLTLDRR